jgi:hypothetical protein
MHELNSNTVLIYILIVKITHDLSHLNYAHYIQSDIVICYLEVSLEMHIGVGEMSSPAKFHSDCQ